MSWLSARMAIPRPWIPGWCDPVGCANGKATNPTVEGGVVSLAFSPDGQLLAAKAEEFIEGIILLDVQTGEQLPSWKDVHFLCLSARAAGCWLRIH